MSVVSFGAVHGWTPGHLVRDLIGLLVGCAALLCGQAAAAQTQPVSFAAHDVPALMLRGLLYPTQGLARASAVLLHGCTGAIKRQVEVDERLVILADVLGELQVRTQIVDSFGPRGLTQICTRRPDERGVTSVDRAADAYAALAWLQRTHGAAAHTTWLIGLSYGAMAALEALDGRSTARHAPLAFDAVAMFYPRCRAPLRRKPAFQPAAPSLLLLGLADDWTDPQPYLALAWRHALGPAAMQAIGFEGAYHAFDSTGPVRLRSDVRHGTRGEAGVHMGGHPVARELAYAELRQFLQGRLAATTPGPR
jgi:dienelactone hydrolase